LIVEHLERGAPVRHDGRLDSDVGGAVVDESPQVRVFGPGVGQYEEDQVVGAVCGDDPLGGGPAADAAGVLNHVRGHHSPPSSSPNVSSACTASRTGGRHAPDGGQDALPAAAGQLLVDAEGLGAGQLGVGVAGLAQPRLDGCGVEHQW